MTRILLATFASLVLCGAAAAQNATVEDMTASIGPNAEADFVEWTLVVVTDVHYGSSVSFAEAPMTETACMKAAKSAPGVFGTMRDVSSQGYGATCLNTRTGAFAPVN